MLHARIKADVELFASEDLRAVNKSQTLLLNEQSRGLEEMGQEVFKFGFGQSPFSPPESVSAALEKAVGQKGYSPVQGLPALRNAIAAFHKSAEGLDVIPNHILVAPGSKSLLYTILASFLHADVFIPAPSWVSYAPQAKLLGHNTIAIHTDYDGSWRMTPETVARALATKKDRTTPSVLILNYPGNPDGMSYDAAQLKDLVEIFRRHNVLVISDEIYGLLDHRGAHVPLATLYPEATITTGGLSKWCGVGGWRLGIAMLPENLGGELKDSMLGIASETYSCAPTPVQWAACEAYQWNQATKDYLFHQRRLLSFLGNWCAEELRQAGVGVHEPRGGFYLFPDFSPLADKLQKHGIKTTQDLCAKLLLETGVALLPGDAFGMKEDHLCARLAYVDFDGDDAFRFSQKCGSDQQLDPKILAGDFAKVRRGIEQLCGWVNAL